MWSIWSDPQSIIALHLSVSATRMAIEGDTQGVSEFRSQGEMNILPWQQFGLKCRCRLDTALCVQCRISVWTHLCVWCRISAWAQLCTCDISLVPEHSCVCHKGLVTEHSCVWCRISVWAQICMCDTLLVPEHNCVWYEISVWCEHSSVGMIHC